MLSGVIKARDERDLTPEEVQRWVDINRWLSKQKKNINCNWPLKLQEVRQARETKTDPFVILLWCQTAEQKRDGAFVKLVVPFPGPKPPSVLKGQYSEGRKTGEWVEEPLNANLTPRDPKKPLQMLGTKQRIENYQDGQKHGAFLEKAVVAEGGRLETTEGRYFKSKPCGEWTIILDGEESKKDLGPCSE